MHQGSVLSPFLFTGIVVEMAGRGVLMIFYS